MSTKRTILIGDRLTTEDKLATNYIRATDPAGTGWNIRARLKKLSMLLIGHSTG